MSDPVTNELIYSVLQKLQADTAELKSDMSDIRLRMTANEEHLATLVMSVSGINHRLDRMGERVERIERRLDLTDAK